MGSTPISTSFLIASLAAVTLLEIVAGLASGHVDIPPSG